MNKLIAEREYGPYRDNEGTRTVVEVKLTEEADGKKRISFTSEIFEKRSRYACAGGQAFGSAPIELVRLWDLWHLNDMRAGCVHQEAQFKAHPEDRPTWLNDYRGASGITLSSDNGSKCPECGYGYGSKWLYEPLPDDILAQCDEAAKGV